MKVREGQSCWVSHCGNVAQVVVQRGAFNDDIYTCTECAYRNFYPSHQIYRLPWAK